MEMNKWLKELNIHWEDLPGNYISKASILKRIKLRLYKIKRGFCFMFTSLENNKLVYDNYFEAPAFDKCNKIDKSGFCPYEFYSLDYSMALYIYPRLCEFKEKYAIKSTPSCFCFDKQGKQYPDDRGNKLWLKEIDKMILAFKFIIKEPDCPKGTSFTDHMNYVDKIIKEGLNSFATYYCQLWW